MYEEAEIASEKIIHILKLQESIVQLNRIKLGCKANALYFIGKCSLKNNKQEKAVNYYQQAYELS